jgi:phosphoribosylformylglycinamidine cyclo-ligase
VLVAGTDGVGTKLKAAFVLDRHDTIGIDCVAMCANDIVCHGAKPLFFLDYIATGRVNPETAADIVKGVADGCVQAGCALIGGETAEMPGFYASGEYDIAGFCVGIAETEKIINGKDIMPGDVLIGLGSSGIHSNGFSLVRRVISMDQSILKQKLYGFERTLGEEILQPTRIYVKTILSLVEYFPIKGIAHITGGGFIENIPRIIPKGYGIEIHIGTWKIPEIFKYLVLEAGLKKEQAFNTFNMGIGMVLCVSPDIAQAVTEAALQMGEQASVIGIVTDKEGIELCG